MKFHYLLVDDLVGKEEFERLVEEKAAESGDLLDERTAAMLVVKDLGRAHVRIRDLPGASSLVCFFAKVLAAGEPKEFKRPDGTAGLVANVVVGDETGKARLTFWDDQAGAVHELSVGSVFEILGRPKGRGRPPDVTAVALQEAACDISCPEGAGGSAPGEEIEVRIIAIESPRAFVRRDGSQGDMIEAVIGNENGIFRLVAWAPDILLGVEVGAAVVIRGATPRENDRGIEFSIGEAGSVSPSDREITIPMDTIAGVEEGDSYSLSGTIRSIQPPHSFATRSGGQSSVRNLVVADGTGEIPVVIWGEKAKEHLIAGDRIEIYNAGARRGRRGDLELHISRGSALSVLAGEEEEVEVEGTIIPARQGTCIDTGDACYLLTEPLPIGYEVRVRGTLHRGMLSISRVEAVFPDPEELLRRLDRFSGRS
ncbi:MAG: nucleotide-binding protein [Methanomicrobiales archaeon]|nr:nucleotide-binding protein [Methanomicrobiales archaeon]